MSHNDITKDITQTNESSQAAGSLVAKRLWVKQRAKRTKMLPWLKRRLNNQIAQLRKDVSRLERLRSDELHNIAVCEDSERMF